MSTILGAAPFFSAGWIACNLVRGALGSVACTLGRGDEEAEFQRLPVGFHPSRKANLLGVRKKVVYS